MTSGVKVSGDVVNLYQEMRLHRCNEDPNEHDKFVLFKIEDGEIVVDKDRHLKVKDFEGEDNVFKKCMSLLPDEDCRYVLYDCRYGTKETPKSDLVFIMWAPESAVVKKRMLYASSKSALKTVFGGVKHSWDVTDTVDIKDETALVEKLGSGKDTITMLEGRDL
ncbi:non-muscle cofilin 1-like [Lampris incognitus]|uniref:non-muscle cofilin 1-like n=1 Tax=Lampris incognitus TaxID=2546036 RepID=UPI0024B5137A|nr:non-muscle cofilin 1-like [Lampris incognitus]